MKRAFINQPSVLFVCMILLSGACKKFLQIPPPQTQLVNTSVFQNSPTATAAVLGIYEKMMENAGAFSNGAIMLYTGLSGDELATTPDNVGYAEFFVNQISTTNADLKNDLWGSGYSLLFQANAVLDGLKNSGLPLELENQLQGEVKFVRAFCYFYLLNLFGKIPVLTSSDYLINAHSSGMAIDSIYRQILLDLTDAEGLLQDDYVDQENKSTPNRVRPNKSTAIALMARVYLFNQDWKHAEETAGSLIIQSDKYMLNFDLNSVFLAGSQEAIWQLMPVVPGENTGEGYMFAQGSGIPTYAFLDSGFMSSFEAGDQRASAWISSYDYNGTTFYSPAKYKVRLSPVLTEYNCVFRLAEQYLIRAEARNEQQDISGAAEDLNIIRARAGLLPTSASDYIGMQRAIEEEWRHEFFCEWGFRWLNLKRTGRIGEVLSAAKPGWQPTDQLYPIPKSEIQNDPQLVQNPGY